MKKVILGMIFLFVILTGCETRIGWFQVGEQVKTETTTGSQSTSPKKISEVDLELGNVKTGMTEAQVLEVMGRKNLKINNSELGPTYYYNDGTEIVFVEGGVYSIKVTDSKYLTPRGLKVGDDQTKVKELYGEPNLIENDIWTYRFENEEYNTFFVKVGNEKVKYIKVSLVM